MTDGEATDQVDLAINRWKKYFKKYAKLINIGIGRFANLSTLKEISNMSFQLNNDDIEMAYDFLFDFIESSINEQSRSVGMDAPIELTERQKNHKAVLWFDNDQEIQPDNENYVILSALCAQKKLPYLIRYEKRHTGSGYYCVGTYPVNNDFDEWSDDQISTKTVPSSELYGGGPCPYCGANHAWVLCSCGQISCLKGEGEMICPKCDSKMNIVFNDGSIVFDVVKAKG